LIERLVLATPGANHRRFVSIDGDARPDAISPHRDGIPEAAAPRGTMRRPASVA
jgi:hypothetical protein